MKQIDFLVCVRCFTFNHAPYIKDAMDGFCMQQTSFPYICVIVDDASTDGEQEVIKSYLDQNFNLDNQEIVKNEDTDDFVMTFVQHKTNANCFFAVYYLKYNHYSIKKDKFPYFTEYHDNAKYIALCEGDDYWIDSMKLQKQFDYLETHPNCSLVHTRFNYYYEKSGITKCDIQSHRFILSLLEKEETSFTSIGHHILNKNQYRIQTATVMFSRQKYDKIRKFEIEERGLFLMGDTQLWMNLLSVGCIYYIPEKTTVYRIMVESATRSKNVSKKIRFALSAAEMRYYYACKYNLDIDFFYKMYLKYLRMYLLFDKDYITNRRIISIQSDNICSIIKSNKILSFIGKSLLTLYFGIR